MYPSQVCKLYLYMNQTFPPNNSPVKPRVEDLFPVSFECGSAGATSVYDPNHTPDHAFEMNTLKLPYSPWANRAADKLPQTVWYKFPKALTIAKFGFSSRDRCCLDQSPLEFQFVGSNDCKNWRVIQTLETKFTTLGEAKQWVIPSNLRATFYCFGIKTLKTTHKIHSAIKHMKMWST